MVYTRFINYTSNLCCCSIFLTERKTVPQLLARLSRPSAIRPSIETQRTITQVLSAPQTPQGIDNDLEVASTSLRLPLDCPAMRIRMRLPGRAITCKHVHCFDLEGYLRMNEKKPTWLCPVCNKPALYSDLFIDQFFIDVIAKCPSNAKAIEYETNGQWKAVGEEKPSRRAQREREAHRAAQAAAAQAAAASKTSNGGSGKHTIEMDQSADEDSDGEGGRNRSSEFGTRQGGVSSTQEEIPVIELDDD